MRHLVDLDDQIAIITWWVAYLFPANELEKYRSLYIGKHRHRDTLTEDQEKEMEQLKTAKGIKIVRIEKILLDDTLPQDRNLVSSTYVITGLNWVKINKAIEKLDQSLEDKDVTVEEVFELSDAELFY
jgi:hypothetical protein